MIGEKENLCYIDIGMAWRYGFMGIYYKTYIKPMIEGLVNGTQTRRFTIVRHYNTFAITNKDAEAVKAAHPDFYVHYMRFDGSEMIETFAPFVSLIREIYESFEREKTPEEFIAQFPVYPLHRSVFVNMISRPIYARTEEILPDEVHYEKQQMIRSMAAVLSALSEKHPMLLLLDNLNMAPRSTVLLLRKLLEESGKNIFVYGAFNELYTQLPYMTQAWESWLEKLEDYNCIVDGGGDEIKVEEENSYFRFESSRIDEYWIKLRNMYYLLDYEQAQYYLSLIYHKIEVEKLAVEGDSVFRLYMLYAAILMYSDMPRALLLCDDLQSLCEKDKSPEKKFWHCYILGQVHMYSGNLNAAKEYADTCIALAGKELQEYHRFMANLLEVMVRMSGWHNIFFCVSDIDVSQEFLEQTQKYGFENHLAYTYIFAYDNDVRLMGESQDNEENLIHFQKGIEIAKRLQNENLLLIAYRKNIMLSSLFGLFQVTDRYYHKSMEIVGEQDPVKLADIYNGLGYNCCASEQYEEANRYYNQAIQIYYRLNMINYVGETLYNMAVNCMLAGENETACQYLLCCVKIINFLHLNDLRVCNISKIFGLLALGSYRLARIYDAKIYLDNALQFLGHIMSRSMEESIQSRKLDASYTACDDDLFLYYYVSALMEIDKGKLEEALAFMESARVYEERSTGYQFFSVVQYEIAMAELLRKLGREKEAEAELEKGLCYARKCGVSEKMQMLEAARQGKKFEQNHKETAVLFHITLQEIQTATKQAGIMKDYDALKKQMEFVSAWQKIIDTSGKNFENLIHNGLNTFMMNFSLDAMIYIRYKNCRPEICYSNGAASLKDTDICRITEYFSAHRSGFVTSKLKGNHMEYNSIVSLFGIMQICSMVCLPYYTNEKLDSVFIMYILMKDNWNAPRTKFMLDESDMAFFNLVLQQFQNSVGKLENEEQIKSINNRLAKAAITDYLTGLYNRDGFYKKIKNWVKRQETQDITFLYIDLDNFKYYNDTFGHGIGDLLLKEVAEILRRLSRRVGFAARYGGDEFLISLKFVDQERAMAIGRKVLDTIREKKGFQDLIAETTGKAVAIPKEKELSCSIGIAAMREINNDEKIAETISRADEMLYKIKHSTKGDVQYSQ